MSDQTMNAPASVVTNTNPTAPKKKYKILIVEDEPDARTLFTELISISGDYEVSSAVDGVDALAKTEANKYDLILLDIVMPKKDGVETLTELKADKVKYGDPVVIMLTNIGGDVAIEKALELGAIGYKLKIDTEPEELLKIIQDALTKGKID